MSENFWGATKKATSAELWGWFWKMTPPWSKQMSSQQEIVFSLYNQKKLRTDDHEAECNLIQWKSTILCPFLPVLSLFSNRKSNERPILWEECSCNLKTNANSNDSSRLYSVSFPKESCGHWLEWLFTGERGMPRYFNKCWRHDPSWLWHLEPRVSPPLLC
jgi:hypothetical protein